jgi:hypothetical protein
LASAAAAMVCLAVPDTAFAQSKGAAAGCTSGPIASVNAWSATT